MVWALMGVLLGLLVGGSYYIGAYISCSNGEGTLAGSACIGVKVVDVCLTEDNQLRINPNNNQIPTPILIN